MNTKVHYDKNIADFKLGVVVVHKREIDPHKESDINYGPGHVTGFSVNSFYEVLIEVKFSNWKGCPDKIMVHPCYLEIL